MFEELKAKARAYAKQYEEAQKSANAELAEMVKRKSAALTAKEKAVFSGDQSAYSAAVNELQYVEDRTNALRKMQKHGMITPEQHNAVIDEAQRIGRKQAKEIYTQMYSLIQEWQSACAELDKLDSQMRSIAATMRSALPVFELQGSALLKYTQIESVKKAGLDVFPLYLCTELSVYGKGGKNK